MLHLLVMVLIVCFLITHPIETLLFATVFIFGAIKFNDWVLKKDKRRN